MIRQLFLPGYNLKGKHHGHNQNMLRLRCNGYLHKYLKNTYFKLIAEIPEFCNSLFSADAYIRSNILEPIFTSQGYFFDSKTPEHLH